jgi:hypothetical protein
MRTCPAAYGTIKSPSSVSLPSQLPLTTAPLVLLYYVFWGVLRIHPGKNPHEKRCHHDDELIGLRRTFASAFPNGVNTIFFSNRSSLGRHIFSIGFKSGVGATSSSSGAASNSFRRLDVGSVPDRCHLNFRFVLEASPSLKRVLVRRNVRLPIEPPFLLIYSSIDKWRASTAGICKR